MPVIVHIATSNNDQKAMDMAHRYRTDCYCPFGKDGLLMGWIRKIEENEDRITLTVEVTEPKVIHD